MTPRQRFLNALNGLEVDRVPVASPTSIVTLGLQEQVGTYFPEAHHDPAAMARLALAGHDLGLSAIVEEMESDKVPLEKLIAGYEEGTACDGLRSRFAHGRIRKGGECRGSSRRRVLDQGIAALP